MSLKRKFIEDELSRFEEEISKSVISSNTPTTSSSSGRNLFVPSQVRPIIAANTYHQVQQKLQQKSKAEVDRINQVTMGGNTMTLSAPTVFSSSRISVPPPPMPPSFLATFVPTQVAKDHQAGATNKLTAIGNNNGTIGVNNVPTTPIILSSAPKLYQSRQNMTVAPTVATTTSSPTSNPLDVTAIQFDVTQKLKKLKAEKTSTNPIAEEAIKAARASSALQTFQGNSERKKKDRKTIRVAGGQVWEDATLTEWPEDDFRIFCGDLGNDVNDELLTRTFNKYPSFQKARVIRDKRTGKSKGFGFVSFREPQDFIKAMKEMDGRYVGSRPIKLRKSTWRQRSLDIVKKKEREKQLLLQQFQNN